MASGPDAWPRIREVFERALALPPAERSSFVAAACADDRSLHDEIERMLESHERAGGFLSKPAVTVLRGTPGVTVLAGQQLGPYAILSRIGAGGMGEVYRARDSRLKRDVALKILPPLFAEDPDRRARFQREAEALAALNHPNIAAIHGLEESSGVRAIVLELVEGETLAEWLRGGAMPIAEALAVARQIAAALEVAHEQGIVHRDLKPANVAITSGGVVKVLDFGLAKLTTPPEGSGPHDPLHLTTISPTRTSPAQLTSAGVLLGTAAYMAPEQARGRRADKRADIWAFGVVLYEMVTGARAFEGDTVTETLGAVIHKEPDWTKLPADLPADARLVLRRCLQKDPTERLRDMGDARLALDGAFTPDSPAVVYAASSKWKRATALASVVLAAVAGGAAVWLYSRPEPSTPPVRYPIRIDISLPATALPFVTMSPDGRNLAYTAQGRPFVYSLETATSRQLASTGPSLPFWSQDSRAIAFASGEKLMRTEASGGARTDPLCDLERFGGGTWVSDNVILFADVSKGIMQVSAAGGTPVLRTKVDQTRGESGHWLPWALPDGRHFLYLRVSKTPGSTGIFVGSLDAPPDAQDLKRLVATERAAVYASPTDNGPGWLVFMRGGSLLAQRFNEHTLQLEGEQAPIVELPSFGSPQAQFTVSANGAIAYVRSAEKSGAAVWVSRNGEAVAEISGSQRGIENPRLSTDGRSLAVAIAGDIWRYDLGGRPPIRLTFDGVRYFPYEGHYLPLWTPNGMRIVYEGVRGQGLSSMPAEGGGGTPEPASPPGHFHPFAWSPDGREIVALRWTEDPKPRDLVRLEPRADGRIRTIVDIATANFNASMSPDGRWLAYTSTLSGSVEVWVRPYAESGTARQVSLSGGSQPVWARDGRKLFYLKGSDMMVVPVVPVEPSAPFTFEPPTRLFDASAYKVSGQPPTYDVAKDGRFVMLKDGELPVTVILNWAERLRQGARVRQPE